MTSPERSCGTNTWPVPRCVFGCKALVVLLFRKCVYPELKVCADIPI